MLISRSSRRRRSSCGSNTLASPITGTGQIHELTSQVIDEVVKDDSPDTVKVVNLLKTLHEVVERERALSPHLISIGARASAIAEAFRNRQVTTDDALKTVEILAREAVEAGEAQEKSGLGQEAFAVRWFLRGKGVGAAAAEEVAKAAGVAFEQDPLWRVRADQERALRTRLYASLIRADVEADDMVEEILSVLRRVNH